MEHTKGKWKVMTFNGKLPIVREIKRPHKEASHYTSTLMCGKTMICRLDFGYGKKEDQANANRIVQCCNSYNELVEACQALVGELENLEQDEGIVACQCIGKTPEMICDPLPCNYCIAKQVLSAATTPH